MERRGLSVMAFLLSVPVVAAAQPATIEYYHVDTIGSVRAVTDKTGTTVRRHDYFPFGEEHQAESGADALRFSGKERDAETGLDYFGARYYGQRLGRFTTVDPVFDIEHPLLEPQLWNRYTYVTNNPFRFIDPDGRQREAAQDRDVQALLARQITVEEYNARIQARGVGAAVGALMAAGPTVWRATVG